MTRQKRAVAPTSALLSTHRLLIVLLSTIAAFFSSGCATHPPTGWLKGGAGLTIPRARWVHGSQTVELASNGRVIVSGNHWITIDAAGRVYNPEDEAVALLRPDGMLLGRNDRSLGWVGAVETRQPGGSKPWISFQPSGEVLKVERGTPKPFGVWLGCNQVPYTLQACALITHMMARNWWQVQQYSYQRRGMSPRGPGFLTPFR